MATPGVPGTHPPGRFRRVVVTCQGAAFLRCPGLADNPVSSFPGLLSYNVVAPLGFWESAQERTLRPSQSNPIEHTPGYEGNPIYLGTSRRGCHVPPRGQGSSVTALRRCLVEWNGLNRNAAYGAARGCVVAGTGGAGLVLRGWVTRQQCYYVMQ